MSHVTYAQHAGVPAPGMRMRRRSLALGYALKSTVLQPADRAASEDAQRVGTGMSMPLVVVLEEQRHVATM